MPQYKISNKNVDERLDLFLLNKIKNISRTQIQKDIKRGLYLVNKKKVSAHYFLKEKDIVIVSKTEITKIDQEKIKESKKEFHIDIVAESKDFLVINKPAGLLVHPDGVHQESTLVDWLIKKYPYIKKVYDQENKNGKMRPGIVHRLDRDVSGLMVLAKNQKMFDCLKKQFKDRVVKKEYLALTHGVFSLDSGRIERSIERSKKTGLMSARTNNSGKEAITEFEVIQRFCKFTLLKVKLLTGRTHQIRVHLKSIGYSILGDNLYQTRDIRLKNKKDPSSNMFLLSFNLGFFDLDNNWQEFKLKEPKWWTNLIRTLKVDNKK